MNEISGRFYRDLCINILFLQVYGRNSKNEMNFKKEKIDLSKKK